MKTSYLRIWWLALALAVVMGLLRCSSAPEQPKKELSESAQDRKNKRGPQITWRDLSFIDTVQVGDTIVHDYVFYNTGWAPVKVKHAISNRPECTCRVPSRDVPIGEQDTVRMTCVFTDVERAGVEIVVEHNTPQPMPTLVYIATVQK